MMKYTAMRGAFLLLALGGLAALPLAFAAGEQRGGRLDCPGRITCPLTGEEVCKDQCPVGTTAETATTEADNELPPCCRNYRE